MTSHTPPTGQQLDEIEARAAGLYEYATGLDDAWQAEADQLAGTDVPALLAALLDSRTEIEKLIRWHREDETAAAKMRGTIERLRADLAKEQRLHGDTIDDRDRATDMADKLAYAVAPEAVIGEHTADNSPWANALDLITSAAEVDKLRATPPMVCINCDTPVGWVDCPTGGWWAHETHPADGHDADPRPAAVAAAGDTDGTNA